MDSDSKIAPYWFSGSFSLPAGFERSILTVKPATRTSWTRILQGAVTFDIFASHKKLMTSRKIIVAITDASGAIYALSLT